MNWISGNTCGMLQIISGKFFQSDRHFEALHRGVFYTNYRSVSEAEICTPVARLLPSTSFNQVATFTYEILEKIDLSMLVQGMPVPSDGAKLADDLAAIISFFFDATCTGDRDLMAELLSRRDVSDSRYGTSHAPSFGVFKNKILGHPEDALALSSFIAALIGLERRSFTTVMVAIRRYVAATYTIMSDIDWAYRQFILTGEILSQLDDAGRVTWSDYDESKRRTIDTIMAELPHDVAERIRCSILEGSETLDGRRFRNFFVKHASWSFFKEEAAHATQPIDQSDLEPMINYAFSSRFNYSQALGLSTAEERTLTSDRKVIFLHRPTLTLTGLARLVRHVIIRFVQDSIKVPNEDFDFKAALVDTSSEI